MIIGKEYYLLLEYSDPKECIEVVGKCIDISAEISHISTKVKFQGNVKDINITNRDNCENLDNGLGCIITLREVNKEDNPEYYL